jgi:hypothetical protein
MAWKIWDYFSLSVSPWVNSVFSFQEIDSFHRSYQVHVNGAVCGIHLWHFQYPCRSSAMHPVCSNWCSVCSAPSPSVHHTHMYTCTHMHTYTHVHKCTHAHTCTRTHTCVYPPVVLLSVIQARASFILRLLSLYILYMVYVYTYLYIHIFLHMLYFALFSW